MRKSQSRQRNERNLSGVRHASQHSQSRSTPRAGRSQHHLSQPGPSQREESPEPEYSQSSQNNVSQSSKIDEYVKKLVKFCLYRMGSEAPIKRADLLSTVLQGAGKNFGNIVKRASAELQEVFGLRITYPDSSSNSKYFFISNTLPQIPDLVENDDENGAPDANKILKLLILTHVFMSRHQVPEASLTSFLVALNLNPDEQHPIFGNIRSYIKDLVKNKYLDATSEQHTQKTLYSWGPRAECEVSKNEILNFVSKVYKTNTWIEHKKEAQQQNFYKDVQPEVQNNRVQMEISDEE